MIGEINVSQKDGLNMDINGQIVEYIAGENIDGGVFVKLLENSIFKIQNSTDTILGITESNGKMGKQTKVYIPIAEV